MTLGLLDQQWKLVFSGFVKELALPFSLLIEELLVMLCQTDRYMDKQTGTFIDTWIDG